MPSKKKDPFECPRCTRNDSSHIMAWAPVLHGVHRYRMRCTHCNHTYYRRDPNFPEDRDKTGGTEHKQRRHKATRKLANEIAKLAFIPFTDVMNSMDILFGIKVYKGDRITVKPFTMEDSITGLRGGLIRLDEEHWTITSEIGIEISRTVSHDLGKAPKVKRKFKSEYNITTVVTEGNLVTNVKVRSTNRFRPGGNIFLAHQTHTERGRSNGRGALSEMYAEAARRWGGTFPVVTLGTPREAVERRAHQNQDTLDALAHGAGIVVPGTTTIEMIEPWTEGVTGVRGARADLIAVDEGVFARGEWDLAEPTHVIVSPRLNSEHIDIWPRQTGKTLVTQRMIEDMWVESMMAAGEWGLGLNDARDMELERLVVPAEDIENVWRDSIIDGEVAWAVEAPDENGLVRVRTRQAGRSVAIDWGRHV